MKAIASLRKNSGLVYIRVMDDRQGIDFKVSTGLYIDPIHWDKNIPGYSEESPAPKEIKSQFNSQLHSLLKVCQENLQDGLTKEWLKQIIQDFLNPSDKPASEPAKVWQNTFWDRAEQYMVEAKGGTEHKSAIKAVFKRLHRYEIVQREIFGNTDFKLDLETFGSDGLLNYMRYVEQEYSLYVKYPKVFAQFEIYHSTMRPSSKNSAQSGGCRLKAFLNWCVKNGFTNDRSFQEINTHKHVYGDAFYLLPEERNRLIGAHYGRSFHAPLVRDMFLFQCYVGCRVGDLFTIQRNQIKDGWLEYVPSKNEKNGRHEIVRVPLHPVALDILKRYEEYSPRLFPCVGAHQYNDYIKMILDFAGIHRLVTIIEPLTREEKQVPLCEVATSHTARKTFIANLYNQVKDQELVAAFTGHAPGSKAFARYRTIGDELKREIIQNIQ